MAELVTVMEAATRLAMSHSTVSRHLAKSRVPRDGDGRFDYEAFAAWRAKNVNPLKARNVDPDFALDRHDAAAGQAPAGAPAAKALREGAPPIGFGRAATAEKAVRARLLDLDYRERIGELADVKDLEVAAEQLGQLFQDALRRRNQELAEELANETDRHRIQALLNASDRDLLMRLGPALVAAVQPFQPAPANAAAAE